MNYKHGKSAHPLIKILKAMKQRCINPKNKNYHNYGGRDISVCEEWKEFVTFYNWAIENGWKKGLQIDRIDNDGNYTSENCRFVTSKENNRNRRDNVYLTAFSQTKIMIEWSEDKRCKVNKYTLYSRINRGWSHEKAISQLARRKS